MKATDIEGVDLADEAAQNVNVMFNHSYNMLDINSHGAYIGCCPKGGIRRHEQEGHRY